MSDSEVTYVWLTVNYTINQCRSETQRLLQEMTQHIQQQSDSHKYLDKLRVENEQMALQEKDRQVATTMLSNEQLVSEQLSQTRAQNLAQYAYSKSSTFTVLSSPYVH